VDFDIFDNLDIDQLKEIENQEAKQKLN